MIEFFNPNLEEGIVSIYSNYLVFNTKLAKNFSDAYRVRIGIDREEGLLYIFKLSPDEVDSNIYTDGELLKISITKSYARIANRDLTTFIAEAFDLELDSKNAIKRMARYDKDKRTIIVDVRREIK